MRVRKIINVRLWKKYIEFKTGAPTIHTAKVTQLLSCSMKVVIWTPWKHGSCTSVKNGIWVCLKMAIRKFVIKTIGCCWGRLFFRQTHFVLRGPCDNEDMPPSLASGQRQGHHQPGFHRSRCLKQRKNVHQMGLSENEVSEIHGPWVNHHISH